MAKILIIIGLLCIASSLAFELPMVFDIGLFDQNIPRIHHQVQAAGPFVQPRNVTFTFEWETPDYTIFGLRIRGSEPRYDRVSMTVNRLERKFYSVDITVINTSFALFWAEPHGYEDIVPAQKAQLDGNVEAWSCKTGNEKCTQSEDTWIKIYCDRKSFYKVVWVSLSELDNSD